MTFAVCSPRRRQRWGSKQRFNCSWDSVVNLNEKLILDLSDPFQLEEHWQPAGHRRGIVISSELFPDEPSPLNDDDMRTLEDLGI